jgi:arsenate reductase
MSDVELLPGGVRKALHSAARDLHREFEGVFGEETIEQLVTDSYRGLEATADVTRWLVVSAERFVRQRLQALIHAETRSEGRRPAVLFLCVRRTLTDGARFLSLSSR